MDCLLVLATRGRPHNLRRFAEAYEDTEAVSTVVVGIDYDLEYGTGRLEIRAGAVEAGQNVAVTDDLLATGGSAGAGVKLITSMGASVVTVAVLVELEFLNGRAALPAGLDVFSMVRY